MAEDKRPDSDVGQDLRSVDSKKGESINNSALSSGKSDFLKRERHFREKERGYVSTQNSSFERGGSIRKIPIALDIFVTFMSLLLVAGIVFGVYLAFVYFSSDYDEKNIEYLFLVDESGDFDLADEEESYIRRGDDIYFDNDEKTYFFGTVSSIGQYEVLSYDDNGGQHSEIKTVIKINVYTKYRSGEGYSVDDYRIGVGKQYALRIGSIDIDGHISEIKEINQEE